MRQHVEFLLNGVLTKATAEEAVMTLSSFLRYKRQLTGTKVVCAEGDCGACSVMVSKYAWSGDESYFAINSCIAMVFSVDGCSIVTVEGLTESETTNSLPTLSEVQSSMVRNFGGQCGFCTPGFVMAITNLFEQKTNPTEQNVKNYLTGNLCRCTGYAPIVKAALDVDPKNHRKVIDRFPVSAKNVLRPHEFYLKTDSAEVYSPTDLDKALDYRKNHPDCTIFSGSTDLGVQFNKGHIRPRKILSLQQISEVFELSELNNEVKVGARVTLHQLEYFVSKSIPELSEFLHIFASPQIKNSATLVGNLANASPIADMTPPMLALDAKINLRSNSGNRVVNLKDFYLGYKKLDLKPDELIVSVSFQKPSLNAKFRNYKVSQRRDLDISTVNLSVYLELENQKVKSTRLAAGGVGATTLRLHQVENVLMGQRLDSSLIAKAQEAAMAEIKPLSDLRGSATYRLTLVKNLIQKFADENLSL